MYSMMFVNNRSCRQKNFPFFSANQVATPYPQKHATTYYPEFDVHVTVHRDKFLIIKPTRCTNFSNLFLEWNFTCFGLFLLPSSGVFHCTHSNGICHTGLLTACSQAVLKSCQQTCMIYTIAVCTVKNF